MFITWRENWTNDDSTGERLKNILRSQFWTTRRRQVFNLFIIKIITYKRQLYTIYRGAGEGSDEGSWLNVEDEFPWGTTRSRYIWGMLSDPGELGGAPCHPSHVTMTTWNQIDNSINHQRIKSKYNLKMFNLWETAPPLLLTWSSAIWQNTNNINIIYYYLIIYYHCPLFIYFHYYLLSFIYYWLLCIDYY